MEEKVSINTHSSIRINDGDKVFYFDPFEIKEKVNDADYIFVTHDHYDHFDPSSINNIKKHDATFVCPESIEKKLKLDLGIDDESFVRAMTPGSKIKLAEDIEVEAIPAYNIGKAFHQRHFNWLGYILNVRGVRYYIAGDTDETEEAKNVSCDVALIPIGGTYTMNVNEAADLVNIIKPKMAIPTHYGSIVGDKNLGKKFLSLVNNYINVLEKI